MNKNVSDILMIVGVILCGIIFISFLVLTGCTKRPEEPNDYTLLSLEDIYPAPEDYISCDDKTIAFDKPKHYRYSYNGEIDVDEVNNYILAVQEAGFINIESFHDNGASITYNANTPDDVYKVRIAWYQNQGKLSIIFDSVGDLYVKDE